MNKTLKYITSSSFSAGEHPYEKVGDDYWKIWIKPLEETNVGVARALFDP